MDAAQADDGPQTKRIRVDSLNGQGAVASVALAEIHPIINRDLAGELSDMEDAHWQAVASTDEEDAGTDYDDNDDEGIEEAEDLLAELQSDPENDSFIPFQREEAEALRAVARSIGYKEFITQQIELKTNILRLLHAFDFPLPQDAFELPEDALWSIFASYLRRFCQVRFKLPHLNTIEDAVQLIEKSSKILVLTGAGISVSCGIPDFRSERGLYSIIAEKYPDLDDPQLMFDIHYFRHNPNPFFELAKEIFPSNFRPSPTHWFIRLLELRGKLLRNYTQNIDTLESAVGLERVVHCHGSFDTASCQRCKRQVPGVEIKQEIMEQRIPLCPNCTAADQQQAVAYSRNAAPHSVDDDDDKVACEPEVPEPIMKPDIVFFGENLPDKFDQQILLDRDEVDLMIIIGSSLKVAPVSDLVGFIPHSVPVILINREPVYHLHHSFDVQLLGYCDPIVGELCRRLNWDLSDGISARPSGASTQEFASLEHQFIPPHIYLFDGAVFDEIKHQRALIEEGYCSSGDEEDSSSNDSDSNDRSSSSSSRSDAGGV